MHIKLIHGRTYLIQTPAVCLGLYRLNQRDCLLVDSGPFRTAPEINKLIKGQGWRIAFLLNTHAHADHCGGNREIGGSSGAVVLASPQERLFLENPWLLPYTLFSGQPPRALANQFIQPPVSSCVQTIQPGALTIAGEPFTVLNLTGHSPGHIGLLTPDRVLFAGDSLMGEAAYIRFPCLLIADADSYMNSLSLLEQTPCRYLCIGHSGLVSDTSRLLSLNRNWMEEMLQEMESLLDGVVLGREEMVSRFIGRRGLPVNTTQYYLVWSSLSSLLGFLINHRRVRIKHHENGIRFTRC